MNRDSRPGGGSGNSGGNAAPGPEGGNGRFDDSGGVIPPPADLAAAQPEALLYLRAAVQSGVPWPRALLDAIALWTLPGEVYQGRPYRYLLGGEALDWLVLAERLCSEIAEYIPPEELETLLFAGRLPDAVTPEEFRERLGGHKYRAWLNYWYGVVVEEALQEAALAEVRKRQQGRGYPDSEDLMEEAFAHLYGATRAELLKEYRREAGIGQRAPLSLADGKEFTYRLSQRRYKLWDPARVASDTRKGIRYLEHLEQAAAAPAAGELAGE